MKPILFYHVEKCGGTTVLENSRILLGSDNVFDIAESIDPLSEISPFIQLQRRKKEIIHQAKRKIFVHDPYGVIDPQDLPNHQTVLIIRNLNTRYISRLNMIINYSEYDISVAPLRILSIWEQLSALESDDIVNAMKIVTFDGFLSFFNNNWNQRRLSYNDIDYIFELEAFVDFEEWFCNWANVDKNYIEDIKNIALEAGKVIMEIYRKDFSVDYKDDESPLTVADLKANEIICLKLLGLYPNIPIMSEENKQIDYDTRKNWEYYWCIDPIDGTKEFIQKNDEFTVNIALIHNNTPVLGVVYAPAIEEIYSAKKGDGAYKNGQRLPLYTNNNPKEKLSVVASKSHLSQETQEFIDNLDTKEIVQMSRGSSLKLCMVAEGVADIYPRLAPTMECDTAAADAIVRESGRMTYRFDAKEQLMYNKRDLLNPWFIVHGFVV